MAEASAEAKQPEEDQAAAKPVEKKKAPKKKKNAGPVYYSGTGRRKNAVARVRLTPGSGQFKVNGTDGLLAYFGRETLAKTIRQPLIAVDAGEKFDVIASIHGGGKSGQAGALRHGIARALLETDDGLRADLKKAGYLTRDPRMIERKKYGLKKARKKPQFSKR